MIFRSLKRLFVAGLATFRNTTPSNNYGSSVAPSHLLRNMTTSCFRVRPKIILFGDSLTQQGFGVDGSVGWAGLLSQAYTRRADVFNRGFSGYNTRHCIELIPRVFGDDTNQQDVLFCTVFLGANDAALPGERQHVPIDEYETNLGTIVTEMRKRLGSQANILLLTPPPVDEEPWRAFREIPKSDRTNEVAKSYGDRVKQVGRQHNCPVVDTWDLLKGYAAPSDVSGGYSQYLSDGLHLNEDGQRLIYEGIMKVIQDKLPDCKPMADDDGEGRYGTKGGVPLEEKLWSEIC